MLKKKYNQEQKKSYQGGVKPEPQDIAALQKQILFYYNNTFCKCIKGFQAAKVDA